MSAGKHAPCESVISKPKILVVYRNPSYQVNWKLLPSSEIWRLNEDNSSVSYLYWPFDVYFDFLGRSVRNRILGLIDAHIFCIAKVSTDLYLRSNQAQLRSCLRALRKHKLKMLKKYYKGCFLTRVFIQHFLEITNKLSDDVVSFLRYELRTPRVLLTSYVH